MKLPFVHLKRKGKTGSPARDETQDTAQQVSRPAQPKSKNRLRAILLPKSFHHAAPQDPAAGNASTQVKRTKSLATPRPQNTPSPNPHRRKRATSAFFFSNKDKDKIDKPVPTPTPTSSSHPSETEVASTSSNKPAGVMHAETNTLPRPTSPTAASSVYSQPSESDASAATPPPPHAVVPILRTPDMGAQIFSADIFGTPFASTATIALNDMKEEQMVVPEAAAGRG